MGQSRGTAIHNSSQLEKQDPAATKVPQQILAPRVYIIILNWNGWRDTIVCLESVFRLSYPGFRVIVCDNASVDESLDHIERWAHGEESVIGESALASLVSPPVPKPIGCVKLPMDSSVESPSADSPPLTLIQTGANLGFAGGNNVGIRHVLAHAECDYVWLLNNDTVVDPEALSAMVRMAEADPTLGICGSLLRSFRPPHEVQSRGRTYSRLTGRTHLIQEPAASQSASSHAYVVEGASMLVRRPFLERVGLLEESYFLFCEELDWMVRARPRFKAGYSPASVVYHKMGASIGSSLERGARSSFSDFYQARNRLRFTWRHHKLFFISVLAAVVVSSVHRLLIGRPQNALAILRGTRAAFGGAKSKGPAFV